MLTEPNIAHTPRAIPLGEARCQGSWRHKPIGKHPAPDDPPAPLATMLYLSPYDESYLYCDACCEEMLTSTRAIQTILTAAPNPTIVIDDDHAFTQLDELKRSGW